MVENGEGSVVSAQREFKSMNEKQNLQPREANIKSMISIRWKFCKMKELQNSQPARLVHRYKRLLIHYKDSN